jgi:hypothetical protein
MFRTLMTAFALTLMTSAPAMAADFQPTSRLTATENATGLDLRARRPGPRRPRPVPHHQSPRSSITPVVAVAVVVCLTAIILVDMNNAHEHHGESAY